MTVKKKNNNSSFFLYFATITVDIMAFNIGAAFTWSSPSIPKLDGHAGSDFNPLSENATLLQCSWIVSLLSLGATFGPILAGISSEKFGRKNTLLFFCVVMIIAHFIKIFATQVEHFYVARFILGLGVGCAYTTVPLYVGEIAEVHNRGLLGCIFALTYVVGILFVLCVGPFITIQTLSIIIVSTLFLFLIVFWFFVPESSYYLVSINRNDAALESLKKMRSQSADVVKELSDIKNYIEKMNAQKKGMRDLLSSKPLKKSLIISVGLMLAQQSSGITSVNGYLQPIFSSTKGFVEPQYAAMIVGTVQLFSALLTTQLIERLGRKILLQISCLVEILAMTLLGTYFYLQKNEYNLDAISWLPVVSIVIFFIGYSLGLGPVSWALIGELFPANAKSIASTITVVVCLGLAFLIALSFPTFSVILGMAGTFWTFAGLSMLAFIFICMVIPETKGKTFEEIQYLISGDINESKDKRKEEC